MKRTSLQELWDPSKPNILVEAWDPDKPNILIEAYEASRKSGGMSEDALIDACRKLDLPPAKPKDDTRTRAADLSGIVPAGNADDCRQAAAR